MYLKREERNRLGDLGRRRERERILRMLDALPDDADATKALRTRLVLVDKIEGGAATERRRIWSMINKMITSSKMKMSPRVVAELIRLGF